MSIAWDGKDSFGKIVDDGTYTATLEAQREDGKCKKKDGYCSSDGEVVVRRVKEGVFKKYTTGD